MHLPDSSSHFSETCVKSCEDMTSLRLHLITYNVGKTLPRDDLSTLLALDHDPDILSVGYYLIW